LSTSRSFGLPGSFRVALAAKSFLFLGRCSFACCCRSLLPPRSLFLSPPCLVSGGGVGMSFPLVSSKMVLKVFQLGRRPPLSFFLSFQPAYWAAGLGFWGGFSRSVQLTDPFFLYPELFFRWFLCSAPASPGDCPAPKLGLGPFFSSSTFRRDLCPRLPRLTVA